MMHCYIDVLYNTIGDLYNIVPQLGTEYVCTLYCLCLNFREQLQCILVSNCNLKNHSATTHAGQVPFLSTLVQRQGIFSCPAATVQAFLWMCIPCITFMKLKSSLSYGSPISIAFMQSCASGTFGSSLLFRFSCRLSR